MVWLHICLNEAPLCQSGLRPHLSCRLLWVDVEVGGVSQQTNPLLVFPLLSHLKIDNRDEFRQTPLTQKFIPHTLNCQLMTHLQFRCSTSIPFIIKNNLAVCVYTLKLVKHSPALWALWADWSGWRPASLWTLVCPANCVVHFVHPHHHCWPVTWPSFVETSPDCVPAWGLKRSSLLLIHQKDKPWFYQSCLVKKRCRWFKIP